MKISRYVLRDLSTEERRSIMKRAQADFSVIEPLVVDIVNDVQRRGNAAITDYTLRYDKAQIESSGILVSEEEFDVAEERVDTGLRAAIEQVIGNIKCHHQFQISRMSWEKEITPGVISGERLTPIASVGLYVPRGKGSFPSVVMMLCIPAVLAGVPHIAMCTPPGPDGTVDAASLVAARLCGVHRVYKMGGAQAIAALAFGSETVTKVEKIIGPGNPYVTAAKRLVYGNVDPGPPAGPSESIVLCDANADPDVAAREWLVEAEHGPESAALLVTDSEKLADEVAARVPELIAKLPIQRQEFCKSVLSGYGGMVITGSLRESIDFTNMYAPEHLRLLVAEPREMLDSIIHAGEVLLGENASIAFGNFSIGVNAILPTGGAARSYSCVGMEDFLKRSSYAYVTAEGVRNIGPAALALAGYEGFPSHTEAVRFVLDRVGE